MYLGEKVPPKYEYLIPTLKRLNEKGYNIRTVSDIEKLLKTFPGWEVKE